MLSSKNFSEESSLFTELTATEAADVNGGGFLGVVVGGIVGGGLGFLAGGPYGAGILGIMGMQIGSAVQDKWF